jgi:hypothetical protein
MFGKRFRALVIALMLALTVITNVAPPVVLAEEVGSTASGGG